MKLFGRVLVGMFLVLCIWGVAGWSVNYAVIDDIDVSPSTRESLIRGREYDFEITLYYRGESADIQIFMSRFMEAPSGSSNIKCYLEETRAPGSGTVTLSFTARVGEAWCNGALVVVSTSPAGGGNGDTEWISWSTVQAPIRFGWSPRNPVVGDRVRFSAEVIDSTASGDEWIWRFRDGDDEITFDGEGPNFEYTFNHAGDNYVQVKWDDRCGHRQAESDYVHVTGSTPVAEFDWYPKDATTGEDVEFESTAYDPDGDEIVAWFWYIGGDGPATGTYLEGEVVTYVFDSPGQKQIHHIVEDEHGLRGNIRTYITIGEEEAPEAHFSFEPGDPCTGSPVTFDARDSTGDIVYYEWDFDDGTGDEGAHVSHVFDEPDHYSITLTVENEQAVQNSMVRGIDVVDCECVNDFDEPVLELWCGEPEFGESGATVTFSWFATDECTPPADIKYRYKFGRDSWSRWGSETTATYQDLEDGYYTFCVEAMDAARNPAQECCDIDVFAGKYTEDEEPPHISLDVGRVECEEDGGKISISWTVTDNVSSPSKIYREFRLEDEDGNVIYESRRTRSTTGKLFTGLSDGEYIFFLIAEDEEGNVNEEEYDFEIVCAYEEDFEPPELTLDCPDQATACGNDGGRITISWSATDNVTSPSDIQYRYKLEGEHWSRWGHDTSVFYTQLPDGYYTFIVEAMDEEGNPSEEWCDFSVECEEDKYSLTVSVSGGGSTNYDGTSSWYAGATVRLIATPAPGWEFSHWTGDASGTSSSRLITMDTDKLVTAHTEVHIEKRPPRVAFSCEPQSSYKCTTRAPSVQWETADERYERLDVKKHLGEPVPPRDRFFVDLETGCIYTHIYFDPVVDVAGSVDEITYEWDFGNGTSVRGSGASVNHWESNDYWASGEYTVTLTVTDGWGQSSTASSLVVIQDSDEDLVLGECPPGEIYSSLRWSLGTDCSRAYGMMGVCIPSGEADTEGGLFFVSIPLSLYGSIAHAGSSWVRAIIEAYIEDILIDKAIDAIE